MSNPSDDQQSELSELDAELERLRAEDEQIAADLDPSQNATDAGDVAALTTAREENAALRAALEAKRERLTQQG